MAQRMLICTPYREHTPRTLLSQWHQHAQALQAQHPEHAIGICMWRHDALKRTGDMRYSPHARARNALLDALHLAAYDYVFWVDVDLIVWPTGLLAWALAHNPDGITAPAVLLQHRVDHFYDTLGYIEHGHMARHEPPWFDQPGPVVALDSVGCCYLIPAQLYRDGARYVGATDRTEHEGVMVAARAQGRPIVANLDYFAVHAWVSDYGALP